MDTLSSSHKLCKGPCGKTYPATEVHFSKCGKGLHRYCKTCKPLRDKEVWSDPTEKKCTGPCGKTYPATEEYFPKLGRITLGRVALDSKCKQCKSLSTKIRQKKAAEGLLPPPVLSRLSDGPDGEKLLTCTTCGQPQTLKNFKPSVLLGRTDYRCRTCTSVAMREYRVNNPYKYTRERQTSILKNRYGITLDDYEQMLDEQQGLCAICKRSAPFTRDSEQYISLFVDHCHKTGVVRGLLCNLCNIALGSVGDNVDILQAMITYLETFQTKGEDAHELS